MKTWDDVVNTLGGFLNNTTNDCVSRQSVIDTVKLCHRNYSVMIEELQELPSVIPSLKAIADITNEINKELNSTSLHDGAMCQYNLGKVVAYEHCLDIINRHIKKGE